MLHVPRMRTRLESRRAGRTQANNGCLESDSRCTQPCRHPSTRRPSLPHQRRHQSCAAAWPPRGGIAVSKNVARRSSRRCRRFQRYLRDGDVAHVGRLAREHAACPRCRCAHVHDDLPSAGHIRLRLGVQPRLCVLARNRRRRGAGLGLVIQEKSDDGDQVTNRLRARNNAGEQKHAAQHNRHVLQLPEHLHPVPQAR